MADQNAGPIPASTPPKYVVTYFMEPEDDADDDSGEQGHAGSPTRARIVEIRCYPAPGRDRTWELRRTVVHGIRRSDVSDLTRETAANYLADKISNRALASTDSWWIVSDPLRFYQTGRDLGSARDGLHQLLLGAPTRAVR